MSITRDFLKNYQNILLRHLILPGSHDAGLADEAYAGLGLIGSGKSRTVTQNVGVGQQALFGSRFFDIRIIASGGTLKAYHSPKDTRAIGGVGQGFEMILDELRNFLMAQPTEFVIVRLAHIKDSKMVFVALLEWMSKGRNGGYVYKGTGNLAGKFVHELAGTIIFVVEGSKLKESKFPGRATVPGQTDGFHTLYQNKQGKPLPDVLDGLCICGEFASSTNLTKIVESQTTNYSLHDKHRTHADNKIHLYCLYWTSTGGDIRENTKQMSANFQHVREMVKTHMEGTVDHCLSSGIPLVNTMAWSNAISREDAARKQYAVYSCSLPNIILYDFVNPDTSREIIGLNDLTLCAT